MTKNEHIHHNGAAETLGVTEEELENMSLREISDRAYDLGLEPVFRESGGIAPGLTLSGKQDSKSARTG